MVVDTNTGIVQDITDLDKEHYESFLEVTERLRIAYNVLVGREGKESSDETPAGNCIKPAVSQQREQLLAFAEFYKKEYSQHIHSGAIKEFLKANNCG